MKHKSLIAITVLGIALRLLFLLHHNLWFDEAVNILISRLPIPQLLQATSLDNNPPLYSLLLHYWMKLIGGDHQPVWFAAWLRIPSLIFSVLTIPATYLLAKTAINERIAKLSALLTAIMPVQLYYAGEARPYSLFIFLSTLFLYFTVKKHPNREEGYTFLKRTLARPTAWLASQFEYRLPKPFHRERKNAEPLLKNIRSERVNLMTDLSFSPITSLVIAALLLSHYTGIVVIIATILYIIYTRTRVISSLISILIGILLAFPWYWHALAQPHPLPWKPNTLLSLAFIPIAATSGFIGISSPITLLHLPLLSQSIIAALALTASLLISVRFFDKKRKTVKGGSRFSPRTLTRPTAWLASHILGNNSEPNHREQENREPSFRSAAPIVFILISLSFLYFRLSFSPRLILPFTPLLYILIAKALGPRRRTKIAFLLLTILAIVVSFSSQARGPKLLQAMKASDAFLSPIIHTAPTTFYPSQLYGKFPPHLYIGPQIFPSQFAQLIGGIPTSKAEAFVTEEFTLVIDVRNTLPAVREATTELINQTHMLTDSNQVDTILIQHFKRIEKLFAKQPSIIHQ